MKAIMASNNLRSRSPSLPASYYTSTTLPFTTLENLSHYYPSHTLTEISSPERHLSTTTFSNFYPSFHQHSLDMEDFDRNLGLRSDFTEEIGPEDSVSQTFHYLDSRIAMPPQHSQSMEIDDTVTIDDTASSALSAPPSSLLTPSAAAYSDAGESIEFSSEVPDISQIPAAFLAKRKKRTAYCWLPCNGIEYFDKRSESWRWKCARCMYNNYL